MMSLIMFVDSASTLGYIQYSMAYIARLLELVGRKQWQQHSQTSIASPLSLLTSIFANDFDGVAID
jgi:hypothetical protein